MPVLSWLCQAGDTLGVIEVFNKYLRPDNIGRGNSVAPTLVTYNLVRYDAAHYSLCVIVFPCLELVAGVRFFRCPLASCDLFFQINHVSAVEDGRVSTARLSYGSTDRMLKTKYRCKQ